MSHLLQESWNVECSVCKSEFVINAADYHFDEVSTEERSMDVERYYEADDIEVECPSCHKKFSRILLYEYSPGARNYGKIENEIK